MLSETRNIVNRNKFPESSYKSSAYETEFHPSIFPNKFYSVQLVKHCFLEHVLFSETFLFFALKLFRLFLWNKTSRNKLRTPKVPKLFVIRSMVPYESTWWREKGTFPYSTFIKNFWVFYSFECVFFREKNFFNCNPCSFIKTFLFWFHFISGSGLCFTLRFPNLPRNWW